MTDLTRAKGAEVYAGLIHKFSVETFEYYLDLTFADGKIVRIDIHGTKRGTVMLGLLDAWCRTATLALRCGVPVERLAAQLEGMEFDPHGATSNADIPRCKSIIDYIMRFIQQQEAKP